MGMICALSFFLKGDIPYKINIILGVAVVYGIKEIIWDKWHGLDTIEDFLFVVVYGAGGTLLTFTQTQKFTSLLDFETHKFVAVFLLFSFHLLCGVFARKREAENG